MALPFMMTANVVRNVSGINQWKPSKVEAAEGFIVYIKTTTELDQWIRGRNEKMKKMGLSVQPYIIIIGPSLKDIHTTYVIISDVKRSTSNYIRYSAISVMHAVDACFKILLLLNAKYTPETVNTWYFVQKGLYRLHTKYDKTYTAVNAFMNDVGISL